MAFSICKEPIVVAPSCKTAPVIYVASPEEVYLVFEQYDGPFVGVDYLRDEWSGELRTIYSYAFLGVDHSHAAGLVPLTSTTHGLAIREVSGYSVFDPLTSTYSGPGITVVAREYGNIPAGSNYTIPGLPFRSATSNTMAGNSIGLGGMAFRSLSEGPRQDGSFVSKYYSETPGPVVGGYFAGPAMAVIWSDGWTLTRIRSQLATPEILGIGIARTDTPARTQHLLTYDDVTKTFTGTKSRARNRVSVPLGKTKLYADYTFLITPDNGDPPYSQIVSLEYDVVAGQLYYPVVEFPWVVAATVYYVSASFSYSPSYFLGFGSLGVGEFTEFPLQTSWPERVRFAMPVPNGEFWDSFDDYAGDYPGVQNVIGGYGFAEEGKFVSYDPENFYDDFESYALGQASIMSGGVGFAEPGRFVNNLVEDFSDDFESYALGAITEVGEPGNFWGGAGGFVLMNQYDFNDDFESYSLGPITSVSGGSGAWADAGRFVT